MYVKQIMDKTSCAVNHAATRENLRVWRMITHVMRRSDGGEKHAHAEKHEKGGVYEHKLQYTI